MQSSSSPRHCIRHRSRSTSSPSPPPPKSRSPSVVANHHKLKKDKEEKRREKKCGDFFLAHQLFDEAHSARHLLQAKRGCSVNFEFVNHTIITSKCKGPNYPPKECCGAFKEFACPYADVLNDLQNDIYLRIQERTGLIHGVDEHELQDKVDKHSNDVAQVPGGEMKSEQGANDFGQLDALICVLSDFRDYRAGMAQRMERKHAKVEGIQEVGEITKLSSLTSLHSNGYNFSYRDPNDAVLVALES
ncbi:GPI-anchored protein [Arachis hypogaea]|nr:GPI-anchored protein [Arachis hypogaea]